MKKIFTLILITITYSSSYGYDKNEIDFYNHSNNHGAVFRSADNINNYKNIDYSGSEMKNCGKKEYKIIKNTANELKDSEKIFWNYKNCKTSEYVYKSSDIINVYNLYRFHLNSRIKNTINNNEGSIVSYLPINIIKGKTYKYYFGMRNNLISFNEDNTSMTLKLPAVYSGIITEFSIDDDNNTHIYEIYLYGRK